MLAAVAVVTSLPLLAQEPAPEAESTPAVSVSGNVTAASDYVFRGLTQTWGEPALQGGMDFAFPHGFYAGLWGSNVSAKSYPQGSLEADLYAGWKGAVGDFGLQLGGLAYFYPGTDYDFDTFEALAALSRWGVELKVSYSLTDYFGLDRNLGYRDGSSGSFYLELNYAKTFESGLLIGLHAGMSDVSTELAIPLGNGARDPDYEDFLAKIGWDFDGPLALTGAWTRATNAEFYDGTVSFIDAHAHLDPGEDRFTVALTYSN